jgi:asparagine synthase (glutamine-hydrolysing)
MGCRGPDGAGEWYSADGRVALGHRRLAIIDLSERGAQPMHDAGSAHVITFNGEIYNYRALRAQLETKGYRFRSDSDTEVLLHLYAEKGEAMVHDLRGMFAFALWDERRKGLFLARDPFGIKPLYYADDGRCIRVASEVKALLAGGGIDTRQEPAGHAGFFLWGYVPEPYTLYKGIRALPAGTTMFVGRDARAAISTYADVGQMLAASEADPIIADEPELADRLRSALLDTVRHHLIADVEVGVFLSAGLDSTTVAGLAAEVGGRLRTVTLGFEEYRGTYDDETPLAEMVARQYGTTHHTVWITRDDFRRELYNLLDRMDQPSMDGVNAYFVARAAAAAGLKVALSGLGGDELFGGYPSYRQIPRLVDMVERFPVLRQVGRGMRVLAAPVVARFASPKYAGLVEYGGDYAGAYLLRRALFLPWELDDVLGTELAREGLHELQTQSALTNLVRGISVSYFKVAALEASWYMRNQLLRDADWASMSHSVEVRVPLVDWTLWRTVSPMLAATQQMDKQAMARTPAPQLPTSVLERAKTGFGIPVRHWLASVSNGFAAARGLRGWARYAYGSHFSVN